MGWTWVFDKDDNLEDGGMIRYCTDIVTMSFHPRGGDSSWKGKLLLRIEPYLLLLWQNKRECLKLSVTRKKLVQWWCAVMVTCTDYCLTVCLLAPSIRGSSQRLVLSMSIIFLILRTWFFSILSRLLQDCDKVATKKATAVQIFDPGPNPTISLSGENDVYSQSGMPHTYHVMTW